MVLTLSEMCTVHCMLIDQLTLFGLATKKDWGGEQNAPPNLAISCQTTMKLAKDIQWVEIFTN